MIGVMLMASSGHRQKIAAARKASRTPINGLETANQKETRQPESWAIAFVFMLFFSSSPTSIFHKRRNFFLYALSGVRSTTAPQCSSLKARRRFV
jgi:hypothetical protein